MNVEALLATGFSFVCEWKCKDGGLILEPTIEKDSYSAIVSASNALYAFCCADSVLYIGKTANSLKKRLYGYQNPSERQTTNWHCNQKIRERLASGMAVRVAAFVNDGQLQWAAYPINLAAGLEDALINAFEPEWNGGPKNSKRSESAEREAMDLPTVKELPELPESAPQKALAEFSIILGQTYYNIGIINVGANASHYLGDHDSPVTVQLGNSGQVILSKINRTANSNGSVRLTVGIGQFAAWFQRHFKQGDRVKGHVLNAHAILLEDPQPEA